MTLKTVPVTGILYNPDGSVSVGTAVVATLTVMDTDGGVVVPTQVSATTDSAGSFTLNLWPNSRGVNGSQYRVRANVPGALPGVLLLNVLITVPDSDPATPVPIATITNRVGPAVLSDAVAAMLAAQAAVQQVAGSEAAVAYIYPSVYATAPLTRPDGTAIQAGDRYNNSTDGYGYTYISGAWKSYEKNTAAAALSVAFLYPLTYATPPATRPDGTAIQNGDRYNNSTDGYEYIRINGVWTNAANSAQAAASSASAAATSASGAAQSKSGADASATAAANYAAAAATGAKFFDTIALGLAGITSGNTFGVKAGGTDGLTRPTIYRNDSGSETALYAVLPASEFDAQAGIESVQRIFGAATNLVNVGAVTAGSLPLNANQTTYDDTVSPAYLGQVATHCRIPQQFNSGLTQMMSRSSHQSTTDLTSLQVVFPNFYGPDSAPGAAATVTASIEYPAGTFTQVKFGGSVSGTIPNGGLKVSDVVTVSIPKNTKFWVRAYITNPSGIVYTSLIIDYTDSGDALNYGASGVADQTMGGTVAWLTAAYYTPAAIIANTVRPSYGLVGDSRVFGANDQNTTGVATGDFERSLSTHPTINMGISGQTAQQMAGAGSSQNRVTLGKYCSHILCDFGINDLNSGARTSYQVLTDLQTIRGFFASQPFLQSTLEPDTTSTDSWATTTNQTAQTWDANRISLNTTIRADSSGFSAHIEIADVVESARNSGLWKAPGYTSDGIHPSPTGYQAIASSGNVNAAIQSLLTPTIIPGGGLTTFSGGWTTDYVPVSPGQQLVSNYGSYSGAGMGGPVFYNAKKAFVAGGAAFTAGSPFTVPAGAVFMRAGFVETSAPKAKTMLVLGTTVPASYQGFGAAAFTQRWNGAALAVAGDGLTSGGQWAASVAAKLGATLSLNTAVDTQVMSQITSAQITSSGQIAGIDLLAVLMGGGDFAGNTTLGSYTDTSSAATFYGYTRKAIETILGYKPSIRLAFITPPSRNGWKTPNGQGFTLKDYADAIVTVCADYGVPVLDLFRKSGINQVNYTTWTVDGVKLTTAGYEACIAKPARAFLETI